VALVAVAVRRIRALLLIVPVRLHLARVHRVAAAVVRGRHRANASNGGRVRRRLTIATLRQLQVIVSGSARHGRLGAAIGLALGLVPARAESVVAAAKVAHAAAVDAALTAAGLGACTVIRAKSGCGRLVTVRCRLTEAGRRSGIRIIVVREPVVVLIHVGVMVVSGIATAASLAMGLVLVLVLVLMLMLVLVLGALVTLIRRLLALLALLTMLSLLARHWVLCCRIGSRMAAVLAFLRQVVVTGLGMEAALWVLRAHAFVRSVEPGEPAPVLRATRVLLALMGKAVVVVTPTVKVAAVLLVRCRIR